MENLISKWKKVLDEERSRQKPSSVKPKQENYSSEGNNPIRVKRNSLKRPKSAKKRRKKSSSSKGQKSSKSSRFQIPDADLEKKNIEHSLKIEYLQGHNDLNDTVPKSNLNNFKKYAKPVENAQSYLLQNSGSKMTQKSLISNNSHIRQPSDITSKIEDDSFSFEIHNNSLMVSENQENTKFDLTSESQDFNPNQQLFGRKPEPFYNTSMASPVKSVQSDQKLEMIDKMARTILGISLDGTLKKSQKFNMVTKVLTALYTPCIHLVENLEAKMQQLRERLREQDNRNSQESAKSVLTGLKMDDFQREKQNWFEERRGLDKDIQQANMKVFRLSSDLQREKEVGSQLKANIATLNSK